VALDHGLFELQRIEALVLRHVAGDFFRLRPNDDNDDNDNDKDNDNSKEPK
jgi:hypothetical protein